MSEKRLTLKQMAARLNRSERTFKKYVLAYSIPHIKLGREMLFNAPEVETYLEKRTAEQAALTVIVPTGRLKSKPTLKIAPETNRFAALLGLD